MGSGIVYEIAGVILWIFGALFIYRIAIDTFGIVVQSKRFKKAKKQYKYAIIIPARNEAKVIAQLLHSIQKQDYPKDLIDVIVVAHNCTDNTAEIARQEGATVFEYKSNGRRKGFAMRHAINRIKKEYENGIYAYDGYIVFDADCIMAEDFVTEMNHAFNNKRYDMFTSYWNAKNTDMGLFSSWLTIKYLETNCTERRPRSVLGISHAMNNAGVLFRNYLFEGSYRWLGLADDMELSFDLVSSGYRNTYVTKAKLYTENPIHLKTLVTQYARWRRGGIVAFFKYMFPLFFGIFLPTDFNRRRKPSQTHKEKWYMKPVIGFQKRYSCFDLFILFFPLWVLSFFMFLVYPVYIIVYYATTNNADVMPNLIQLGIFFGIQYIQFFILTLLILIRENKNVRCSGKIFLYIFMWPIINISMYEFVAFGSLVYPSKWGHKPVPRFDTREIEQVHEIKQIKEYIGGKHDDKL